MTWIISGIVYIIIGWGVYGGQITQINAADKLGAIVKGLLWPVMVLIKLGNQISIW